MTSAMQLGLNRIGDIQISYDHLGSRLVRIGTMALDFDMSVTKRAEPARGRCRGSGGSRSG